MKQMLCGKNNICQNTHIELLEKQISLSRHLALIQHVVRVHDIDQKVEGKGLQKKI